jgi:LPXTG-site transpeptidase (sortase) family protein
MKSKKTILSWVLLAIGVGFLAVAAATLLPGFDSAVTQAQDRVADEVNQVDRADAEVVSASQQAEAQTTVLLPEIAVAKSNITNIAVAAAPPQANTIISPELPSLVEIPAIKVNAKVIAVGPGKKVGKNSVEWSSPNKGQVGWHNYSGRLGEAKNIVLNGHNNIQGAVFRKLYTLQAGDLITVSSASYIRVYQVQEVLRLLERGVSYEQRVQNAQYIQPMNDDRLTLISCWPETNNTHRIIVIAKPISQNY